jgi:RNA polymerase sigma factor (sigma-70 family)
MSEAAAAGVSRLFSDERLTRRAVGGDERAFAAIFGRYHQSLFRFCLAIVGNPEDAQEALQNTMLKVLRALPGEEREIELKPWLYRIAHNEAIDLLRRRRETRELDVEQVAPGYGLAEDAATRERLRGLVADLKDLPERQREVLVMRELSGLEFEEIATALDTSGAVARQTLYEARQSLRQMEVGREMSCDAVTRALSDGDGRVRRRRDVRAHLRACPSCRAFRDEIEGRQRNLAALSPLPAVAAAGMLQGLLGGSQGATGTGLAATLGGGAAKTIGASAAAKGVATAAVVAAVGITAADRTGVIHLGLPGEKSAKQAPAGPGQGSASQGVEAPKASGAGSQEAGAGKAATEDGAARRGIGAVGAAGHRGHRKAASGVHAKGQGHAAEHPHGRGHEKQYPAAATPGQEAAAGHQPPSQSAGNGDKAVSPSQPSHPAPAPAPGAPPKEAPSSPPAVTPEPETQPPAAEEVAPESSYGSGKASENIP